MVSLGIARETKTKCAVHDLGTTPVGGACAGRGDEQLEADALAEVKRLEGGTVELL